MTPQERQLVEHLFERLATLERERRDPGAERAIRQGLARAPNAVYALVQTVLVQDEALRRANDRIEELEAGKDGGGPDQEGGGFLDSLRNAVFGSEPNRGSGSVPRVRSSEPDRPDTRRGAGAPMGVPPGFRQQAALDGQGGPAASRFAGAAAGPAAGAFGGGGSFLGTAAAAAVGVIGGSLLLSGIRDVMGPAQAEQSAMDTGTAGGASPWGEGGTQGDHVHQAGLEDGGGGADDGGGSAFDDFDMDWGDGADFI